MTSEERFLAGLEVRRAVLGDVYVDSELATNGPVAEMQRLVTEYCWGEVWTRPGLSRRDRSLINIGILTALNRPRELSLHATGALRNGCTTEELFEVILQTVIYCGVPAALDAFAVVSEAVEGFAE